MTSGICDVASSPRTAAAVIAWRLRAADSAACAAPDGQLPPCGSHMPDDQHSEHVAVARCQMRSQEVHRQGMNICLLWWCWYRHNVMERHVQLNVMERHVQLKPQSMQ